MRSWILAFQHSRIVRKCVTAQLLLHTFRVKPFRRAKINCNNFQATERNMRQTVQFAYLYSRNIANMKLLKKPEHNLNVKQQLQSSCVSKKKKKNIFLCWTCGKEQQVNCVCLFFSKWTGNNFSLDVSLWPFVGLFSILLWKQKEFYTKKKMGK